jgi:hypothetical protein
VVASFALRGRLPRLAGKRAWPHVSVELAVQVSYYDYELAIEICVVTFMHLLSHPFFIMHEYLCP